MAAQAGGSAKNGRGVHRVDAASAAADAPLVALVALVSASFGVRRAYVRTGRRGPPALTAARRAAIYLARVALGWTEPRVAAAFRCDRRTVSRACRHVERGLDDPAARRRLATLQVSVLGWRCTRTASLGEAP